MQNLKFDCHFSFLFVILHFDFYILLFSKTNIKTSLALTSLLRQIQIIQSPILRVAEHQLVAYGVQKQISAVNGNAGAGRILFFVHG